MRVISGKLKGKTIPINQVSNFRPTLSRIREDLFNILSHNNTLNVEWSKSIFCDLFCGTGSIGIEAISRGCNKVIFNDIDKNNLNYINQFLKDNNELEYELLNVNCYQGNLDFIEKCNIIFIDPPYKDDYELIDRLIFSKVKKSTLIIYESEQKLENKNIILTKKYKNKSLFFIQKD